MIPLTGLDEHPLVHALGWTLLHFCWQGAIVAGMLWCVLGLLGSRSSQARYLAACAAMLLMVALPLFTFGRIAADEYHTRSAVHRLAGSLNFNFFLQVNAGDPGAPWPVRIALSLDRYLPWLLAAWVVGALFFVARLNFGLMVARRLSRVGIEPPSAQLQRSFDELRQRAGVSRAVRLLHSAKVQVPTVVGWLRPVVLIPASCLTGLSTQQIEAIFCHELAHVRRHDYLVSVFQSLAEALLFYHPAVWWVSRQVRRERECCCDELAIAHGGDALAYARALSYLEERRSTFPEFVLGANGGVLTMRIKRLLGCTDNAGAPQFAALLLLALVATISGSYAATLARAQKATPTPVSAVAPIGGSAVGPEQTAPNASAARLLRGIYKSWLTQDVRWIITSQESDAFLRLQNDNERDAFINSFWKRRDPPGSEDGSYREAYYARMAYSNEHFASDRAGWSTDRGHVYLLYGKPDSIEAHPSGGEYAGKDGSQSVSYPFEVWHYRYLAGIGDNVDLVFADTCRCGNYNYTVDHPGQTAAAGPQAVQLANRLFTPARMSFQPTSSVVRPAADSTITGVVFDKTGAVIARAYVRATKSDGSFEIASHTDADGRYSLASLPAGKYTVEAGARGFDNLIQEDVPVEKSQQLGLNLRLKVGGVEQSLTVVAPAAAPPVAASIALRPPPPVPAQSGKPIGPIRVSSGTMAGAIIKKVDPIYPPDAKASHVSGTVVLRATISKLGTIESLEVVSGPSILIMSSIDAVKQWIYKPYLLNGEPTEVDTTINIHYAFGDADPPADTSASTNGDLQVKKIGGDVSVPIPIYMVEAEYSPEARAARFSGVVLVNLVVDQQGLPQNVHVLRSVGLGLDAKAIEAVKQYRFRPAMEHDKPVPVALNVEVNFQSDSKPDAIARPGGAAIAGARVTLPNGASAPVLIHSVYPEFTEEARKAKLMGVVLVNMTVDQQGRPQNVHVLRGVGHGLDAKAVEAVKQYRFKPAMKDNKPVEEALNVEVNFQIF